MARKKEDSKISPDQLRKMAARYAATLDARAKIDGPTVGDLALERARGMCEAAQKLVATDVAGARHLIGFVQGVLLCRGVLSWEYLSDDDRR